MQDADSICSRGCSRNYGLFIMELPAPRATFAHVASLTRGPMTAEHWSGTRPSLARHYEIPSHPVAGGAPFTVSAEHHEELARWFGDAALVLESVRAANKGDAVRCWPHHFDIATLITVSADASVGIGMEPGDGY